VKQEVDCTEGSVAAGLTQLTSTFEELRKGSTDTRAILVTITDLGESFKLEMSSFNMTPPSVLYALLEAVQMLGDQHESEHSAPESLQ
jgi:hypothetical protein